MAQVMTATRAAGQARLEQFSAKMGRDYAQGRNFDRGPAAHRDVSMLSAYIRRRLITEPEVIATAIKTQGAEASAKFIDEVIWRSYFKVVGTAARGVEQLYRGVAARLGRAGG